MLAPWMVMLLGRLSETDDRRALALASVRQELPEALLPELAASCSGLRHLCW